MIITYLRSSSLNTHSICPMQFYGLYTLGLPSKPNLKADKGTIVHKVLEIMADAKKAKQENKRFIDNEICGRIKVTGYDINVICEQVYDYYVKVFSVHNWSDKDKKDCINWVWKTITLNSGMFDPRKRDIFASELHFDFEIDKEWAKYNYTFKEEKLVGKFALKGTIDLITKHPDGILEVVDYKTGKRKNWATNEEKTYDKLQDDPQLRFYHYALSHVYPDIEEILVTIFYINDGGPFTLTYSREDLPKTEEMLRKKFEIIKSTTIPRLNRSWMCTKLCSLGCSTFEGTHVEPIKEFRSGQTCKKGDTMTKCEQTLYTIQQVGIDKATEQLMNKDHKIGHYKPPGEA